MNPPKSVYERKPKRLPKSLGFSKYCLDYDGANDYVDIPNNILSGTTDLTISAWVKTTTSGPIVIKRDGGVNGEFMFEIVGEEPVGRFITADTSSPLVVQ